jgi:DNA-binding MarR family transcriptional regulator
VAGRVARSPRIGTTLRPVDYQALADLRYQIRRFLRVREVAARAAGVEPQQYLLLLQVKGLEGRAPATMSLLAERLQIRHHAVVQLVDRLAKTGMVERRREGRDRREVVVRLRPRGETALTRLADYSLAELTTEGPSLVASLNRLVMESTRGRVPSRNGTRHGIAMTTNETPRPAQRRTAARTSS